MLTACTTVTSSDAGLRATPDKSRPFASLTTRRPQTARRAARPPWPWPQTATLASTHTTGRCHLHQQTDFGRAAPTCPPSTGHGPMLPCCLFRKILHSDFRQYGTFGNTGQISCLHQPRPQPRCWFRPLRQCHDHEARTNLGPPATSPTDASQTAHRFVARSRHGDNLPPRRPDTPRAFAIFTDRRSSGVLLPTLSTTNGPQITAATAAIAAASGKFGVLSPTRRTSPVMTNKGV